MPRNWDAHYSEPTNLDYQPSPLLVEAAEWLVPGRALDIACGYGRNALYLAGLGWQVTAVDSSPVGIRLLRERAQGMSVDSRVAARIADLERGEFAIERGGFDLICDFFYLQRDLFRPMREGVREGGIFAGAIHLFDDRPEARRRNPDYLLHPGELRAGFAEWKILFYSEGDEPGRSRRAARIVARKA